MPKKPKSQKPRVVISRVISSAERHSYTPAYELSPDPELWRDLPAHLPAGTVLEVVSIPKEKPK